MLETGKRDCPDGKLLFLLAKNVNCDLTDLTDDASLIEIALTMFGNPQASSVRERHPPPLYPTHAPPTSACPACASKDAEIQFLRAALASALDRIPKPL